MKELLSKITNCQKEGSCLLLTALDGPGKGDKALFCSGRKEALKGNFFASFPEIRELIPDEKSGIYEWKNSRIYAEFFEGQPRMVICGGGYVSLSLIRIAKMTGFFVTILEDRESFARQALEAGADEALVGDYGVNLAKVPEGRNVYFVIVTRGHLYDTSCLRSILKKQRGYMGMIGSRRKTAMVLDMMRKEGFPQALLDELHAPIGLAIGAETPEEIAVSIMAEVIQCKNQRKLSEGYRDNILSELGKEGKAVLAQIIAASGSTPRKAGAKMVIREDGTLSGTIGGGNGEAVVIERARDMIKKRIPFAVITVEMNSENAAKEGMICGGRQEVLLELEEGDE